MIVSVAGGKCESMVARPHNSVDKVRQLQRRLFTAAKSSPGRRFHALFDRIWRDDILLEAWRRVSSNKGAAGIDGETLKMIEQRGADEFLRELAVSLQTKKYRPPPVRRQYMWQRLFRLLVLRGGQRKKRGPGASRLRPADWPHARFVRDHGLYKLLGV